MTTNEEMIFQEEKNAKFNELIEQFNTAGGVIEYALFSLSSSSSTPIPNNVSPISLHKELILHFIKTKHEASETFKEELMKETLVTPSYEFFSALWNAFVSPPYSISLSHFESLKLFSEINYEIFKKKIIPITVLRNEKSEQSFRKASQNPKKLNEKIEKEYKNLSNYFKKITSSFYYYFTNFPYKEYEIVDLQAEIPVREITEEDYSDWEIFDWTSAGCDWYLDYFNAGLEWWGTYFFSIHIKSSNLFVIIAASTTD